MRVMGSSAAPLTVSPSGSAVPSEVLLRNWPLVHDGWRSLGVVLGTVLTAAAAYWLSGSWAMTVLTAVVLVSSMWRFWLPVRYQLTAEGIGQFSLGRRRLIPWPAVVRYRVLRRGVLLCFDRSASPLAQLATVYLAWGDQREQVMSMVDVFTRRGHASAPRGSSQVRRSAFR